MSKPGEYKLPYSGDYIFDDPNDTTHYTETKFQEDTVAAVEKAHAERNCGNCVSFYSSRCSLHDVSFTSLVSSKKLEEIIKCNEWKSKEADNADA